MKLKRITTIVISAVIITSLSFSSLFAQSSDTPDSHNNRVYLPLINSGNQTEQATDLIPGQYIVVLKEDQVASASVDAVAADMVAQANGEILFTYDAALQGFAARFSTESSEDAIAKLKQDPRVAYVEQDRIMSIEQENGSYQKTDIGADVPTVDAASTEEVKAIDGQAAIDSIQYNPVWGLDRNDQRYLPLNGSYIYYTTGYNVRAYIIDTGIRTAHTQFGGRASYGYDAVDGSLPADDCNGHGTHVAGTVGGSTYGVAKGVRLIAVRVLGCTGSASNSTVIAGVNWVTNQKRLNPSTPMVANMSLSGSGDSALDNAVYNSILNGVTYVVAAGNNNANACNYSPARTAGTITVGATDRNDYRASFSNYGGCVDIFAPGVGITSAWYSTTSTTATLNGTSMAAPHVTGVVALYLQRNPSASPATVRSTIFSVATSGIVKNPGSSSYNRLVYNPY